MGVWAFAQTPLGQRSYGQPDVCSITGESRRWEPGLQVSAVYLGLQQKGSLAIAGRHTARCSGRNRVALPMPVRLVYHSRLCQVNVFSKERPRV